MQKWRRSLENKQAITKYKQASGFISIADGDNGNFSFKLQESLVLKFEHTPNIKAMTCLRSEKKVV